MRSAILLLALTLTGCSLVVANPLPGHHGANDPMMHVTLAAAPLATPAPRAAELIELSAALRSVTSMPSEVAQLERVIVMACAVLAAIGLINAALLIRLLGLRARERPRAVQPAIVAPRTCGCGATISARSTTGRCRQCALEQRRRKTALAT